MTSKPKHDESHETLKQMADVHEDQPGEKPSDDVGSKPQDGKSAAPGTSAADK